MAHTVMMLNWEYSFHWDIERFIQQLCNRYLHPIGNQSSYLGQLQGIQYYCDQDSRFFSKIYPEK